mmetsp:Transcript_51437/g.132723  ORF Transcript_51437/g.132723 Transcript_51437/m.132723 type:complete len:246 (-) Transcript_51437:722-1459(-)
MAEESAACYLRRVKVQSWGVEGHHSRPASSGIGSLLIRLRYHSLCMACTLPVESHRKNAVAQYEAQNVMPCQGCCSGAGRSRRERTPCYLGARARGPLRAGVVRALVGIVVVVVVAGSEVRGTRHCTCRWPPQRRLHLLEEIFHPAHPCGLGLGHSLGLRGLQLLPLGLQLALPAHVLLHLRADLRLLLLVQPLLLGLVRRPAAAGLAVVRGLPLGVAALAGLPRLLLCFLAQLRLRVVIKGFSR